MLSRSIGPCLVVTFASVQLLFPSQALTLSKPESVGMSSDRLSLIGKMIQEHVDNKRIPGAVTLVARRGKIVHLETRGWSNIETQKPLAQDSIFRIASMTKPIASVALMMLHEKGYFRLTDPISDFIPEFKNPRVAIPRKSPERGFDTVPAEREISFQHLLSHTAGLATGAGPLEDLYRNRVLKTRRSGGALGPTMRKLASLPLHFQPGSAWEYDPATDVVGYLVEIISGMPLDLYLRQQIFEPLGMEDTYFYVPQPKASRQATVYNPAGEDNLKVDTDLASSVGVKLPPRSERYFGGSGGLSCTIADYFRFCQMSLNGGEYNGARLLSPKTIQLMTTNHMGDLSWTERFRGYRFGLGYRVLTDVGEAALVGSVGSYGWGGAYNTYFWIDPKEELIGILMTQIQPCIHLMLRRQIHTMATAAILE